MGKIDTVAGIEMFAMLRNPNGIQCDRCGVIVNLDRATYREELEDLKLKGWIINSEYHTKPKPDYCPDCREL